MTRYMPLTGIDLIPASLTMSAYLFLWIRIHQSINVGRLVREIFGNASPVVGFEP